MANSPVDDAADDQETMFVEPDDRYQVLTSRRRQFTIEVLESRLLPVTLDEVATAVTGKESDSTIQDQVAVSLHHHHLPMLDEVGIIDYERDRNRITACRVTLDQLTSQ